MELRLFNEQRIPTKMTKEEIAKDATRLLKKFPLEFPREFQEKLAEINEVMSNLIFIGNFSCDSRDKNKFLTDFYSFAKKKSSIKEIEFAKYLFKSTWRSKYGFDIFINKKTREYYVLRQKKSVYDEDEDVIMEGSRNKFSISQRIQNRQLTDLEYLVFKYLFNKELGSRYGHLFVSQYSMEMKTYFKSSFLNLKSTSPSRIRNMLVLKNPMSNMYALLYILSKNTFELDNWFDSFYNEKKNTDNASVTSPITVDFIEKDGVQYVTGFRFKQKKLVKNEINESLVKKQLPFEWSSFYETTPVTGFVFDRIAHNQGDDPSSYDKIDSLMRVMTADGRIKDVLYFHVKKNKELDSESKVTIIQTIVSNVGGLYKKSELNKIAVESVRNILNKH